MYVTPISLDDARRAQKLAVALPLDNNNTKNGIMYLNSLFTSSIATLHFLCGVTINNFRLDSSLPYINTTPLLFPFVPRDRRVV
jgi:hypothetical protein